MRILIDHAWILSMDEENHVYKDGWLLTDGDQIAALGEGTGPEGWDRRIDGRGGILLPGFVNTHCHVSMIPFRTLGDDCPDRLRRFLFPLEQEAMTRRLVYLGARYGIAEMLLSGITTFLDMYYFEDEVAAACEEMGIRGYLGETLIGQPTPDSLQRPYGGFEYQKEFIEKYKYSSRIHPVIAPHGTTTLSMEKLAEAHEIACREDLLYTLHCSEMDYEMAHFAEQGLTPIQALDRIGAVDAHLAAAHCIHASEEDLQLLKEKGAGIAHCIGSNTKAGKGVAPMKRAAELGIPFGFGTDGASSGNTLSLFDQMRLFACAQKTACRDRSIFPAEEIVRAASAGGARVLHGEQEFGKLAPGMQADLVLVETESVNMFPIYNPWSALVYSAGASNVDTVLAAGKVVVSGGKLTDFSLGDLREELKEAMQPFAEAAEKYSSIV